MSESHCSTDAEYLASMCEELAHLAEQRGLAVGAYLLKMARLEFSRQEANTSEQRHN